MTRIEWTGINEMRAALERHEINVQQALRMVAEYWAAKLEGYAKENRPWTDRTSNARAGLHGFVEELSQDTVALYLSHGMDYGKHLELKYQGRYAIIMPTLRAHYGEIMKMLREVFG